ncbi:tetrapyrrole methylase [Delphinella strobiligena]|nr:tetrapyrrole methylase [Delphinella strobiligena]
MTTTPALLTAVDSVNHVHLIVGSNPLASARCTRALEVGAIPKIIAPADATVHYGLAKRIEEGKVEWIQKEFEESDLTTLGREEVDHVVDAVFVSSNGKSAMATHISTLCRRLRIPVNVADSPNLCTFTLLSTHTSGPLQIGVTTSGKGCKMASRIRREIAAALPAELGPAVERLGCMRRRIWEEDARNGELDIENEEDDVGQDSKFNKLVTEADVEAARNRRLRWLSQICEYWPLRRLAAITDADVDSVLQSYSQDPRAAASDDSAPLLNPTKVDERRRKGRVILAGSGPGHPDLLTALTLKAIRAADVILADKLVPAGVLDLIPRRTPVHIARKFPGNAEAAQEELLSIGLAAAKKGQIVLRLKQGDPYLYGRGAEEFHFFRNEGFEVSVLPGITSALSAPLFANIPVTHRAVSDQVLVCTGTGRKGVPPNPPVYLPNQSVVFLMSLHRLEALRDSLYAEGKNWPKETPCAVIERASCPDQRVIRSTLEHVCAAVEEEGSRPPGLLVVGHACEVLEKSGGQRWVVEEGFTGFDGLGEGTLEGLSAELRGDAQLEENVIPA